MPSTQIDKEMPIKASVFIATSVDGFIARPDGGLDWLPEAGSAEGDEDYSYQAFIDSVDAIVMGRKTFETALGFGAWPYGAKPVVVLSSHPVEIPESIAGTVESMSGPPREVLRRLAARGMAHVYVDGGKTIQGFLREGLIQRMIITRIPILIGRGIPLFGLLERDIRLRPTGVRQFPNGLLQIRYEVLGGGEDNDEMADPAVA
jgi:dihydrofolate reductase